MNTPESHCSGGLEYLFDKQKRLTIEFSDESDVSIKQVLDAAMHGLNALCFFTLSCSLHAQYHIDLGAALFHRTACVRHCRCCCT